MLWREAYDTRRLGDISLTSPKGTVFGTALIVAAGVAALPEFGVWTRLVESDFGAEAWRGILVGEPRAFEEALPPSRLARCDLRPSIELPIVTGRVLAGVWSPEGLRSVMVGPATEEAWDEFSAAVQTARED